MAARYITSGRAPSSAPRDYWPSLLLRSNRWIDLGSIRKHRHHRSGMARLNKFSPTGLL